MSAAARWGLLSTADINGRILHAAGQSESVEIAAIASRDGDRAEAYAREHGIPRAHGSYEELLADGEVDCIYIPLPNSLHFEWSLKALRAGKHVLCEKPLTPSRREAEVLVATAHEAGLLLREGFMWRHHPQTAALRRLLAGAAIGEVRTVRAVQGFDLVGKWRRRGEPSSADAWRRDVRLSPELAGGAMLDVGCYCLTAIRLVAGEPAEMSVRCRRAPSGVDVRTWGEAICPNGVQARFECFMDGDRREELEIIGSQGSIQVRTPFLTASPSIRLERTDDVERLWMPTVDSYRLQLEAFGGEVKAGQQRIASNEDIVNQATAMEIAMRALNQAE